MALDVAPARDDVGEFPAEVDPVVERPGAARPGERIRDDVDHRVIPGVDFHDVATVGTVPDGCRPIAVVRTGTQQLRDGDGREAVDDLQGRDGRDRDGGRPLGVDQRPARCLDLDRGDDPVVPGHVVTQHREQRGEHAADGRDLGAVEPVIALFVGPLEVEGHLVAGLAEREHDLEHPIFRM